MPDVEIAGAIDPAVSRLHRLAWEPGAHLHPAWWSHLDLDGWQGDYLGHMGCRRAIDALIVQRRAFPVGSLPANLSEPQERLMSLEPRLPMLLTALGFYSLRAPDLLRLGDYRRQMAGVFGEAACDQLATLVPLSGGGMPAPAPERFLPRLLELGCAWMQRDLARCVVWRALAVLFPPPQPLSGRLPDSSPLVLLFRMDRLL